MKIDIIAGARPNFVKIASIIDAIRIIQTKEINIEFRLIHTGQHYDENMSKIFFTQLNIPEPDINFEVGSGTQAEQTAAIMLSYEKFIKVSKPDVCLVVGDVTSTMACAITAKKMNIVVAHVEAGIRSGDKKMPEEINRIITDSITDYFFTTSETANVHLKNVGVDDERIFFVGNTMIDTLLKHRNSFIKPTIWDEINLIRGGFIILTLHRPNNVDEKNNLKEIIEQIIEHSRDLPLIFPMHPRTYKVFNEINIKDNRLHIIEPLSYLEFNYLVERSKAVITDSGGITEETTVLGIPCMTLRDSTERPETINIGTNELLGANPNNIKIYLDKLLNNQWKQGTIPTLWDGKTAERIINHLIKI